MPLLLTADVKEVNSTGIGVLPVFCQSKAGYPLLNPGSITHTDPLQPVNVPADFILAVTSPVIPVGVFPVGSSPTPNDLPEVVVFQ